MKVKRTYLITLVLLLLLGGIMIATLQAADDGPLFTRNISRTPDTMTGASQLSVFSLYVPAQDTQGDPPESDDSRVPDGELGYFAGDCNNQDTSGCELIYSRPEARPLLSTYNDGIENEELNELLGIDAVMTGAGFGERDAFAALSLDDGATWKNYNLSDSADRSSFTLQNGHEYPGDVFKEVHVVEGNRVVVAWISRFCESGAPLYSWLEDEKDGLLAAYPELDHQVNVDGGTDPDGYYQLYMDDIFTVGGTQKSVDYTAQGFPEVGEIPYGCVWVARGTLEQDLDDESGEPLFNSNGDPVYDIEWRASERLTSGRRDPHQINITSSPGAGFIIEWQEDPEGLRPGKGLGPGEGWSGAVANSKTDLWYTYIDWDHFGDVCLDDVDDVYCTTGTLAEFTTSELFGQKPKAAVPFAMPVRLTDNSQCKMPQKLDTNDELLNPYCYADFNDNGTADFCATTESWTNPGGQDLEICVTEDGRHMTGRTASTRVRWAMKPYTMEDGTVSAWVLLGEEKMKALGTEMEYPDTGADCPPNSDGTYPEECVPVDIGKNMWYHTFEFNNPELVAQGLMLNAPALSPETGEVLNDGPLTDEWENEFYDTEIARRINLFVNSPAAAIASDSKTMGLLFYKQGILFQGGPADIFIKRLVLPDTFDPAVDNPFDYANVQCVEYADDGTATAVDLEYADGSNPNYVRGLCPVSGMNVSGTTIVECDEGLTPADTCAEQFPFSLTYEEWASDDDDTQLPKVTEWAQAPDNYNDASWENPYDVSKGHRGFIDGDFVMMMYATAPNWKAGTVGNEAYNLYIRRSFDGGQTWTTLPASFAHINGETYSGDGTTTCEDYGWGGTVEEETCTDYGPGDFEQARNVSRLTGSKVTVLDPRYSPSGGMLKKDFTNLLCDDDLDGVWENCGYTEAIYPEDIRDPSTFFATFETGDNTVVDVETGANPLDMYYSRASNFGDDWDEQDACATDLDDPWYPSAGVECEEGETEMRWDWLENGDDWATEASVYGNPSGDRFYAVWNQELPVDVENEIYTDMDTEFRRIFFNLTDTDAYPSASIMYISHTAADYEDEITFIGAGRDYDRLGEGIVDYEWSTSLGLTLDGAASTEGNAVFCKSSVCKKPGWAFVPGFHTISFKVQDNEGNWSVEQTFTLFIAEELTQVYLPVTIK